MRRGVRKSAAPTRGGPPTGDALRRLDAELLAVIDADFGEAAVRAGDRLKCGPSCTDCCHSVFPITRLDVWRLGLGLEALRRTDPERAARIVSRAIEAVEALERGFPGDSGTGRLDQDERVLDAFLERHEGLRCPVLDPNSGCCDLYEQRPVACRTFGPPLRYGERTSPPCHLCFGGADVRTVESCRMEPDRRGLEAGILEALGVPATEWETLIAHAVARANR